MSTFKRYMQPPFCHNEIRRRDDQGDGFTLIELSITLTIIALIAAGIFGARELIASAEARRIIAQIDEYKNAVNIFRTKYAGLPGDILNRKAVQFGFTASVNSFRNGNGRIDSGANYIPDQCGEANLFWNDLGVAGLIKGSYNGTDGNYGAQTCGSPDITALLPRLATNPVNSVMAYSDSTDNSSYFVVYGGATSIAGYGWYVENANPSPSAQNLKAFPSSLAFSIDTKLDDGQPFSGQITARSTTNSNPATLPLDTALAPANGVCVSNASGNPYNVNTNYTDRACVLQFPMM